MQQIKTPVGRKLSWWTEARDTLSLGGHLVIVQTALVAMAVTDVVMLSGLGPQPLAAGALVNSIAALLQLFCFGVLQAVAPMIGAALGAQRGEKAGAVIRHAFLVATAMALLAMPLMLALPTMLALAGQPPAVTELARSYAPALAPTLLPALWLTVFRVTVPVFGRAWLLSPVLVVGAVFHAVANHLLIHGMFGMPALGLPGVAVSYLFTYLFMLAIVVVAAGHASVRRLRIFAADVPWSGSLVRQLLGIGLPIGAVLFIEQSLFAGSSLLMGRVGATELAAHALVLQWVMVMFIVPLGLSNAALTRVSLAVGRRDKASVLLAVRVAVSAALAFHVAGGLAFLFSPDFLTELLLDPHQADGQAVVTAARPLMRAAALLQGLNGMVVVLAAVMRACRDTRAPMLQVVLGYWVIGLGAATLLGQQAGAIGIWAGMCFGFVATVAMLQRRVTQRLRHLDDLFNHLEVNDAKHL